MTPPRAAPKRLTHFLCIPLVTPTSRPLLQRSLQAFRADVQDDRTPENPNGIPDAAIRPPGTLHLTLGVMSLSTPERVQAALALLRSLDLSTFLYLPAAAGGPPSATSTAEPATPAPLTITLRGLHSMHPPARTSVLYAPPLDPSGRLGAFCAGVRAAFAEFLTAEERERPLVLHATIVNTVYAPGPGPGPGPGGGRGRRGRGRDRVMLDARDALERYADVTWMESVRVEKVALCRMGARSVGDGDQEYVVEGEVEVPAGD